MTVGFFNWDWNDLRALGNSRAVGSNMLWIFIIPITAKLFSFVSENNEKFGSLGVLLQGGELPFSWYLLYFSSLFFAIGSLFFIFKCPRNIKEVGDFGDFDRQGRSDFEIIDNFGEYLDYNNRNVSSLVLDNYENKKKILDFCDASDGSGKNLKQLHTITTEVAFSKVSVLKELKNRRAAFEMMRNELKKIFPFYRYTCSCMYFLGFICLSIVFFQSFLSVIKLLF